VSGKRAAVHFGNERVLFFSDLDGTCLEHRLPATLEREAEQAMGAGIDALDNQCKAQGIDLIRGYITARPPSRIISQKLPDADFTITHNGALIYEGLPTHEKKPLASWLSVQQSSGFYPRQVKDLALTLGKNRYPALKITTIEEVLGIPKHEADMFQVQFCVAADSIPLQRDETPKQFSQSSFKAPQQLLNFYTDLCRQLHAKGISFQSTPPYPSSLKNLPYLQFDISAPKADKDNALAFLMKTLDVRPDHLIVAGDGQNDTDLKINDGRKVIVVGPNQALRRDVAQAVSPRNVVFRPSREVSSLGVLNGLKAQLQAIQEEKSPFFPSGRPPEAAFSSSQAPSASFSPRPVTPRVNLTA